ncbi:histidine kinase [Microbacterium sp. zg-Y818]|uniref:sensor histidine kinase n=1 Tax=unclassified Microbacterium TaxID=2609290 RepID=UPI00214B6918|nr:MULTISPECIES: histidine kinase [unclassified Microbacterium]MCR2800977.1 histidine kinase [Microbacterium sp. zg.Y818]WIM23683.1 histidine kinase [Microbacterium sp. zg-Y818]
MAHANTRRPGATVRAAVAPALTAALAVGYVGIDLTGAFEDQSAVTLTPIVHGALVALQAVALLWRHRAPNAVVVAVVALDLIILATSGGELGVGALAVIIATYAAMRWGTPRRATYGVVAGAAAATTLVGSVAMAAVGMPFLLVLLVALARIVILYALPAAAAEYMLGRERLADAVQQQKAAAERERQAAAERELRAERTALARELHDIAGHHLSGIIVSAQAAAALTRSDPDEARATLQTLQQNARTALTDLRRTVGLLREDESAGAGPDVPGPTPAIAAIPALVDAARRRGQDVTLHLSGDSRPLGVLAETAAYRMVQESLANAARHAADATCDVTVAYRPDTVEVAVRNTPPAVPTAARRDVDAGFGIAGMRERADLVGGRLVSGPQPDGGWLNRLTIPLETERSAP